MQVISWGEIRKALRVGKKNENEKKLIADINNRYRLYFCIV
jgi:hypothetical protein